MLGSRICPQAEGIAKERTRAAGVAGTKVKRRACIINPDRKFGKGHDDRGDKIIIKINLITLILALKFKVHIHVGPSPPSSMTKALHLLKG